MKKYLIVGIMALILGFSPVRAQEVSLTEAARVQLIAEIQAQIQVLMTELIAVLQQELANQTTEVREVKDEVRESRDESRRAREDARREREEIRDAIGSNDDEEEEEESMEELEEDVEVTSRQAGTLVSQSSNRHIYRFIITVDSTYKEDLYYWRDARAFDIDILDQNTKEDYSGDVQVDMTIECDNGKNVYDEDYTNDSEGHTLCLLNKEKQRGVKQAGGELIITVNHEEDNGSPIVIIKQFNYILGGENGSKEHKNLPTSKEWRTR